MPTVSRSVGGSDFTMDVSDSEMQKLETCVASAVGGSINITHDGGHEEEVHCIWLLGVMERFTDCRKIMDAVGHTDDETRMEMLRFAQQLFSSDDDDEDAQDNLRQAFLGGCKQWGVPIDDLFEEYEPDVVRECVEIGFTITKSSFDNNDMEVTVTPQSHEVAVIVALATRHIPWQATDLTPFNSQSDFCPADVCLLQNLLRSKLEIPTNRTTSYHWVGHIFWSACTEVGVTDKQFLQVISSDPFWEYISETNVPKMELLVREAGKPVQYKTRLDRIIKNFMDDEADEELEEERKKMLVDAVKKHYETKPAKTVDELFHDYEGASVQKLISFFEPPQEEAADAKTPFESAAEAATSLKKLSNDTKLKIYSLYKQATEGDNTRKQPGMFDFEGKAKWGAWNSVKGMSKEEASSAYISLVNQLQSEQK